MTAKQQIALLQAQVQEQATFIARAFQAHPNLDLDIEHLAPDTPTPPASTSVMPTLEEAIRRLQHMYATNSNDPRWYRNQIAQTLRRFNALPQGLQWPEDLP